MKFHDGWRRVRVAAALGFLAAWACGPVRAAQVAYDYLGITPGGPIQAHASDVDVFPYTVAADQNDFVEATAREYASLQADDALSWFTADPGNMDEMFVQFDMTVTQAISLITQIDFLFNGNSDGAGAAEHQIWLHRTGTSLYTAANWDQLTPGLNITPDVNTNMTRSLTSNFANYIDAATGAIRWGVYVNVSSEDMRVNYARMTVTYNANYSISPSGLVAFGYQDINDGQTAARTIIISNTGASTLNITGLTLGGTNASEFLITSDTGQTSLGVGQSRTINIAFDPATIGLKSANLTITSSSALQPTQNIRLAGTAGKRDVQLVSVAPAPIVVPTGPLDYGSQDIAAGPTTAVTYNITNIGSSPLSISSIGLEGGDLAQFPLTNAPVTGLFYPGETTTAVITFDPSSTGRKVSSVSVQSNDLETPRSYIALLGNGTSGTPTPSPTPSPTVTPTSTATPTPTPPYTSAQTLYDYRNITPGGIIQAHTSDVDAFPYTAAGDQNNFLEADPREYAGIFSGDGASWTSPDPGPMDEMFVQFDMLIKEPLSLITRIDLLFNGYSTGGGSAIHQLWVHRTGTDPFTASNWVQVGADLSIVSGVNTNLTGAITSNFSNYVDAASGAIRWGVFTTLSSESLATNYASMAVTYTPDYLVEPAGILAYGYWEYNDGPTPARRFTIKNTGLGTLSIFGVSITGVNFSEFLLTNDTLQASLTSGQTRTFDIAFDPASSGVKLATLTILTNAANQGTLEVELTGTGGKRDIQHISQAPAPIVTPVGILDFGSQAVAGGPTAAVTFNLSNIGTHPLLMSAIGVVSGDAAQFPLTNVPTIGLFYPGEATNANVTFDPSSVGLKLSLIEARSNDTETPNSIIILSGVGTSGTPTPTPTRTPTPTPTSLGTPTPSPTPTATPAPNQAVDWSLYE